VSLELLASAAGGDQASGDRGNLLPSLRTTTGSALSRPRKSDRTMSICSTCSIGAWWIHRFLVLISPLLTVTFPSVNQHNQISPIPAPRNRTPSRIDGGCAIFGLSTMKESPNIVRNPPPHQQAMITPRMIDDNPFGQNILMEKVFEALSSSAIRHILTRIRVRGCDLCITAPANCIPLNRVLTFVETVRISLSRRLLVSEARREPAHTNSVAKVGSADNKSS